MMHNMWYFGDLLDCGRVSKQTFVLGVSLIVPKIRPQFMWLYI